MKKIAAALGCCMLLCSCATHHPYPADDPRSAQVWTPTEVVEEMAGSDPVEPFNRAMFTVNDVFMSYLVMPISWIYGSILPKEVIKRIDYVSDNLAFPGRMISCFLQLKFLGGGIELVRFITNFTVGIVGLFDVADYWLGLPPGNDNMGKAFAYWGIGPGFILVLPLTAHITFRDHVGSLFDKALDFKLIIPYAGWVSLFNSAVNSYDGYNLATETAYDTYDMAKMGLVAMRYASVRDYHRKLLPAGPVMTVFGRPGWYDRRNYRFDFRKLIDAVSEKWAREDAEKADFLLFRLGWDQRWGTEAYFGDYPCLDGEVMDFILEGDYKGIGFDVIGLDPIADADLTRHKKLFAGKEIVNIENLCHLDRCGKGLFWFSCFPLKIENSDGSPIRAVAWFE